MILIKLRYNSENSDNLFVNIKYSVIHILYKYSFVSLVMEGCEINQSNFHLLARSDGWTFSFQYLVIIQTKRDSDQRDKIWKVS